MNQDEVKWPCNTGVMEDKVWLSFGSISYKSNSNFLLEWSNFMRGWLDNEILSVPFIQSARVRFTLN